MNLTEAQWNEFDRAFVLWRGCEDDVTRAKRALEILERKAQESKLIMLKAREALTQMKVVT